jgi:hypothetical protein
MDKMQHVNVGDTERFVPCFSMFLWWVQTYVLTELVWINCCIFLVYHSSMSSSSVDFMSPLPHGPGKCLANAPELSIWLEDKHFGSCVQSNHEVWLHGCTWWCADMQRA